MAQRYDPRFLLLVRCFDVVVTVWQYLPPKHLLRRGPDRTASGTEISDRTGKCRKRGRVSGTSASNVDHPEIPVTPLSALLCQGIAASSHRVNHDRSRDSIPDLLRRVEEVACRRGGVTDHDAMAPLPEQPAYKGQVLAGHDGCESRMAVMASAWFIEFRQRLPWLLHVD